MFYSIVWTPFLKDGGVNFDYLPQRLGGDLKFKKMGWKYDAGAGLLKGLGGGGGGLALFLFNFFKVYHLYI